MIRVSDFKMKPIGSNTTKYVELDGSVRLTSFKYQGNHADTVIDKAEMKGNVLPAPVDPKKKRGGNS